MAADVPREDYEQIRFVAWLEEQGYKYTAIPNSTFTKSWKVKNRNRLLGLRAGLPDLFIIAENTAIWVEMKRVSGGRVTTAQKEWIEALQRAGQHAKACNGFAEAREFVESVLGRSSDLWPERSAA